jgi:hypothetical protein
MEKTMNQKQGYFACALLIGLSGLFRPVYAEDVQTLPGPTEPAQAQPAQTQPAQTEPTQAVARTFPGSKISFAPLPVEIYLLDNQKPTVVFSTPCAQMEKMTNGFPPLVAFENFMFTWIANVNESDVLPIRIEPVCL